MENLDKLASRLYEESEFSRAAEEERILYSFMISLKLGDIATKQRFPIVKKLLTVFFFTLFTNHLRKVKKLIKKH